MNIPQSTAIVSAFFLLSTLTTVQHANANGPTPHCGARYTKDENYWEYDAEAAYKFGLKIQDAVRRRDLVALFSLAESELHNGPRRRYVENKSFNEIFPKSWRSQILDSEPDCAPVGWRGFMLGGGLIWYRSGPFRIIAINGATEEKLPPVPAGWKVGGQLLSPECFAREWLSSDNFEIFGEFASQFGIRIGKFGTPSFTDFRNNPGKYLDEVFYPFDPIILEKATISPWRNVETCTVRPDCFSIENATVRYTPNKGKREFTEYRILAKISTNQCQSLAPNLRAKCLESYLVKIFEPGGSMSFDWYNIYGLFELRNNEKMIFPLKNFGTLNSALNFLDNR